MIFKLHYWFLSSGMNAICLLLGVFIEKYTDANSLEIGFLYMIMPFTGLIFRPIICAMADREQAYKKYLMICLTLVGVSYAPFVVIPLIGPKLYVEHARFCFYLLVVFKTVGDIALDGVKSVGDSLAINYAKRVGEEFSLYRIWGTAAWMFFGIVTGLINETPLLPKYVPGFIVLIGSNLANMVVVWLWPDEYFIMVTEPAQVEKSSESSKREKAPIEPLLPKEVVLAHMRKKVLSVFCCCRSSKDISIPEIMTEPRNKTSVVATKDQVISKTAQLRILGRLLRRDPRIIMYLMFFVTAGLSIATQGFFFISLSDICHNGRGYNFSEVGGLIQVCMAIAELITFYYYKRTQELIGRVNICSLALLLCAIKFTFYGTLWSGVNPYFALLIECLQGMCFAIFITLMAELGHLFANEVQFILPELIERDIISPDEDPERLKLSLSATMQALTGSANDGLGRGLGSLIYGIILQDHSYETLWLGLGIAFGIFLTISVAVNLVDYIFKFKLGLNTAAREQLILESSNNDGVTKL